MKLKYLAAIASVAILSVTAITVSANNTETVNLNTSPNKSLVAKVYSQNGVAIKGFDPVAYFQENKPVKGNQEYSYRWGNATWRFASAANRDLFASNPEKYAPQYGGFCAWAVSQGYTAPIDPNAWKIVDGKLYLNYNRRVQRTWERDIPGNIAKADRNWPNLQNK